MKTYWFRITAPILLGLLFFSANAQVVDLGDYKIGIRGGLSAANLLFVEAPNKIAGNCPSGDQNCFIGDPEYFIFNYKGGLKNTRFGLVGGLFIENKLNEKLALELGLNYEQKGINLEYKSHTDTRSGDERTEEWRYYKRDIRNDYLLVPLIAKYKFNAVSRFYVTGGIYTGFLINTVGLEEDSIKSVITSDYYLNSRMNRLDQEASKDLTSVLDAGIVLGGGASLPLGDHFALNVDARLNVGVLKVDRNYNNRFEKYPIATSTGYGYMVISENYYRGLNSQARNISLTLTAGLSRSF